MAGQSITAAHPDRPVHSYDRITIAQRVNRAADMRLIASAPDLLAALAWAIDQIDDDLDPDHQQALAHARALVGKFKVPA